MSAAPLTGALVGSYGTDKERKTACCLNSTTFACNGLSVRQPFHFIFPRRFNFITNQPKDFV